MKSLFTMICGLLLLTTLRAQDRLPNSELENPSIQVINKEYPHATFISYDNRENALLNHKDNSSRVLALNGIWKFNFVTGVSNRIKNFADLGLDLSNWKEIAVPSNMEIQGYGIPIYVDIGYEFYPEWNFKPPYINDLEKENIGYYRRDFEIPRTWNGQQIFVHFGAIKSVGFVWVDGQKVGLSNDSKTPQEFDIAKYAKPGKNTIAAEVFRWSDAA